MNMSIQRLLIKIIKPKLLWLVASFMAAASFASYAVTIPIEPFTVQGPGGASKPMIMLGLGRDHRMFYEAYNDASDIDGDGTIDIRFKPSIVYLGLFDSNVCYTHSSGSSNTDLFSPSSAAIGTLKTCSGKWSGNWLNYAMTSRIDALRVVMYGGPREVDTATQTILRRGYIPQDAHSWAKEYTNLATDGYLISDYTPLAQPATDRRHFFGTLTPNASTNCNPIANCSNLAPWLSVVTDSNRRVWEWASTERPVLNGSGGGTRTNYTARVEVCTTAFNTGCKLYPSGAYKPVGILHDFGENDAALFGMMSGSYDSHLSGGRLRKVVSSFSGEIDPSNGTFLTTVTGIVSNFNTFRIYGFNRGRTDQIYSGGVIGSRTIEQGEAPDWGNPIGELMYEAVRYFANKGAPTGAYINNASGTAINTIDDLMGLSRPAWDRPYKGQGTSTAEAPYCAKATLLTISDTNISFDSDQLPGVSSNFSTATFTTDLSGRHIVTGISSSLNVSAVADFVSGNESNVTGLKFIGQSGSTFDSAPSAKSVASLGSIRGLAPEEPTKRGSYYSASVAHYAKVNDLNSGLQGNQTVDNFFVALASPLLRIEPKLPNGRVINLVPFAKSIGGAFGITAASTAYQPTNQIVDYYVQSIANSGPADANPAINGGRYEAVFRINFEDVEQGNDHDMDAIVVYTVRANADNTLDVIVQPIYQAGGVRHRMGYIISGTTNDGIYLVVQDESDQTSYFLNVPPGRTPGYCNTTTPPGDCTRLPYLGGTVSVATQSNAAATQAISSFRFTPNTGVQATYLRDPLWYAAKWGGFSDIDKEGKPNLVQEWDPDGDGQPDNYFFVQNPTKLKESLTKALRSITEKQSSSSNLAANSTSSQTAGALLYRANYTSGKWIGEVEAFPITASDLTVPPIWKASDKMPNWDQRNIYMNATQSAFSSPTLVNLRTTSFGALPTVDQTNLGNATNLNYIRGDVSSEVRNGGSLRNRDGKIADIIHSSPLYDEDSGQFYIGANGGMVHAFNALTGTETFAIIPRQVIPRLKNLSSTGYSTAHEYFVDGDIARSFKITETNDKRYLYSLLGRGGKGLFSFNPNVSATSAAPTMLWEYTPAGDLAASTDVDLGLMMSRPQFAILNNGKAALLVGNGYNSTSTKAVLYIFMINPDGTLFQVKKLDTGVAGDNGLSGPAFYDNNDDLTADFIYAGDLKGNLWKFDVSDTDPNNWKLSNGGVPMFKAVDENGNPQPITAPAWATYNDFGNDSNTLNKPFVYVGTGSYFKLGDVTDLSVQSWYGIIDPETTATVAPLRTELTKRTIGSYSSFLGKTTRDFSNAAPNDMLNKKGWFYDLNNPVNGERINTRSILNRSTVKPALFVTSFYPVGSGEVCIPGGGDSYLNAVDPFSGADLEVELFSGFGFASSIDLNVGIAATPLFLNESPPSGPQSRRREICYGNACKRITSPPEGADCYGQGRACIPGTDDFNCVGTNPAKCDGVKGRISWREIIRD